MQIVKPRLENPASASPAFIQVLLNIGVQHTKMEITRGGKSGEPPDIKAVLYTCKGRCINKLRGRE